MNVQDFENMSDDQLEGLSDTAFEQAAPNEQASAEQQQEDPLTPTPNPADEDASKPEGEADAGGAEGDDKEGEKPKGEEEDTSDAALDKQTPPVDDKSAPADAEKPAGEDEKKDPPKEGEKPASEGAAKVEGEETPIDYEAEYKKLIGTPIKANGKDLTLKSVDEVMRLVQQGAGYAKKMEELKPARKSAAMLEAAGLLGDENALGYMIDLYNGNPQALAKLVKELKIDIFALDLEGGDKYTPKGHLQTDEAVTFNETLKEVRTLEGGREALALIDSWDQQSKDMIWNNAQAVRQIYDYKQTGVYDTVASEVERRRTLGQIPPGTPFIVAFQQVGDEMAKAAAAQSPSHAVEQPRTPLAAEPAKPAPRTPVASGPAPRKVETPDARAAAAASPRTGAGQVAKQPLDIYSLTDKDIENMSSPPA